MKILAKLCGVKKKKKAQLKLITKQLSCRH